MEKFYNIEEQKFWDNEKNWTEGGHEWSSQFGTTEDLWNKHLFDDLKEFRNKKILEIAPGHGRITQFLLILAKELIVADLNPNCIKKTKEKLGDHVSKYFVCDGKSLPFIADESQDLVFSYDSFVHMHKNVIDDYLSEINRVLVDGGKGIIHHSNLLGGTDESFKNWGGRSNMGVDLFKELVEKYGMIILDQKNIKISDGNDGWNGIDTITIFQKTNKINKN
jgi:SAM-dependent methyltransferase